MREPSPPVGVLDRHHESDEQQEQNNRYPRWSQHPPPAPCDVARQFQGNEKQREKAAKAHAAGSLFTHVSLLGNFTVRNCRENLGNSCDKVLPLGLIDMGLPKPAEPQTLTTPFAEPLRPAPVEIVTICHGVGGSFRFGNDQLVTVCNRLSGVFVF